jgi:hypothetical protein
MTGTRTPAPGSEGGRATAPGASAGIPPWDPAHFVAPRPDLPTPSMPAVRRRRYGRPVLIALGVLALVLVSIQAALSPPPASPTPGPTVTPVQALPRLDGLLQQTRAVLPPGADLRPGPVAHYDCGTDRQSVYETVTVTGAAPTPGAGEHRWDALADRIQQDWAARGYVKSDDNASEAGAPMAVQWTWQVEDENGHAGPGTHPTGNGWDIAVTEVEDKLTDGVMLSANTPCLWITGQPPAHR